MEDAIDVIEYRGYTIRIYPDDCDESPREWDNLGHMAAFHRRYDLGDENRPDGCDTADEFIEWLEENKDEIAILLPLYLYDHSGITMWTDDGITRYHQHMAWDGGQVGYIYVTKDELREEYHVKRLSKKVLAQARKVLIAEVQAYDQYLTGDVYGYRIFADEEDIDDLDSCWGFYGQNDCIQQAKEAVDYEIERAEKAEKHLIEAGTYEI